MTALTAKHGLQMLWQACIYQVVILDCFPVFLGSKPGKCMEELLTIICFHGLHVLYLA